MSIEDAIVSILNSAGPVDALVAGRIFPNNAVPNTQYPDIVYRMAGGDDDPTLDGGGGMLRDVVELNLYSLNFDEVVNLSAAVVSALKQYRGTVAGINIQTVVLVHRPMDVPPEQQLDPPVNRRLLTFDILYQE